MCDTDTDNDCVCGVCGRELLEEHNMGACSCDKCLCLCNNCGMWSDMTEEWYCGRDDCVVPDENNIAFCCDKCGDHIVRYTHNHKESVTIDENMMKWICGDCIDDLFVVEED